MKQMIVMRTDLGMRKGKMIAQGAHASMGAILPYLNPGAAIAMGLEADPTWVASHLKVDQWLAHSFTKICVGADSLDAMDDIYTHALAAGLIAYRIVDNGKTEFAGIPTPTCIAIGPDTDEALDPITGELKLL